MKADDAARTYAAYLEECYQGEVGGEALFRAMANATQDEQAARKLRVLEQLERETKEFLRPELEAAGGAVTEDPKRIADGKKLGTRLARMAWPELMRTFESSLVRFIAHFEKSESLAPRGKEDVLRHVTAHERALLEFTKLEIAGRGAESLAPVVALLRK